ncbi:MAG: hypothetical protein Kow0042_07100 [Calditrichia bacterium]
MTTYLQLQMVANITQNFSVRKYILYSLFVIVPVGFLCKFYSGPASGWVRDNLAGVFYEIFWCLVCFYFWPYKSAIIKIVIGVFGMTSLLEIAQLWHPDFLEAIRANFLGRTLIGTSFAWWDFPHYFAGSVVGWVWLRRLHNKYSLRENEAPKGTLIDDQGNGKGKSC